MIEAELPDGRVLEFPDGTDQDVIQATVRKMLGIQEPTTPSAGALPTGVGSTIPPVAEQPGTNLPQPAGAMPPPTPQGGAMQTAQNIGKVWPVLETGAQLATGAVGQVAGGLTGLGTLALGGGLERAGRNLETIQGALTYEPKTEGGKQLSEATAYPFTKLAEGASAVADPIAEAGYPNLAASVATGIEALPLAVGAKGVKARAKTSLARAAELTKKIEKNVSTTVDKAIKPSIKSRGTLEKDAQFRQNMTKTVEDIVDNKGSLVFDEGSILAKKGKLPESLNEFSQAINQRLKSVFEEYDSLAKQTDKFRTERPQKYPINEYPKADYGKQLKVDTAKTGKALDTILNDKVVKDMSPETIAYAWKKKEALTDRGTQSRFKNPDPGYTASEAQSAVKMLNESLKEYYNKPSATTKGKVVVDALIANDLRAQLDSVINKATGKEYASLKKKYGAIKAVEDSVIKRSLKEASKTSKGLIPDITDILSGHQAVSAIIHGNPSMLAPAAAMKLTSTAKKIFNDPNRRISSMFKSVEKLKKQRAGLTKGVK